MSDVKKFTSNLCVYVYLCFFFVIRVLCENKILIETLEKREIEIQQLRTQNSGKLSHHSFICHLRQY